MAESGYVTRQFSSEHFIESCGAILFDLSNPEEKKVCLVYYRPGEEWLLAKGQRRIGETRKDAAIREIMEETGYRCHLYPVAMATRVEPVEGQESVSGRPGIYSNITEPMTCTIREIEGGSGVKLIWWYVAELDEGAHNKQLPGEPQFIPKFFSCQDALEKLKFRLDRDVLKKAIQWVEQTPRSTLLCDVVDSLCLTL